MLLLVCMNCILNNSLIRDLVVWAIDLPKHIIIVIIVHVVPVNNLYFYIQ